MIETDDEIDLTDSEDLEHGRCLICGRTLAYCSCADGDAPEKS